MDCDYPRRLLLIARLQFLRDDRIIELHSMNYDVVINVSTKPPKIYGKRNLTLKQ